MRRLHPGCSVAILALWLGAFFAASCGAQPEAERQTRLILPRSTARAGPTLLLQTAHTGGATCLSLRADGAKLVSGGADGYAIIYDVETGVVERTFPWHPSPLTSVSLSPDGHYMACGLQDGRSVVWDLTGKAEPVVIEQLLREPEVRYSPRGDYLAVCGLPSPAPEGAAVLLCSPSGTQVISSGNCVNPLGLSFAPDGGHLIVAHQTGALIADLKRPGEPPQWAPPGRVGRHWEGRALGPYTADTCFAAPSGAVLALGGRPGAPHAGAGLAWTSTVLWSSTAATVGRGNGLWWTWPPASLARAGSDGATCWRSRATAPWLSRSAP